MLVFAALALLATHTTAIDLDVVDRDSICSAVSTIAEGIMDYYEGTRSGGVVGMFQPPYYWWEAGEAFGLLLDQWYYCSEDKYESIIQDALIHQANAPAYDYVPANQTDTEANDDQAMWGFTVMLAAERGFPLPSGTPKQWDEMVGIMVEQMWGRWDVDNCNGGLRWQILSNMSGWDYKNAILNAGLFQLAARMYRFSDDTKYLDIANQVFDWCELIGMLNTDTWAVYDGALTNNSCQNLHDEHYSYNYGLFLLGAAYLYNATSGDTQSKWHGVVRNMLSSTIATFFDNNIMYEWQCYHVGRCNTDQRAFRALFARTLGATSLMAPDTHFAIQWLLTYLAKGAAALCSGGSDGVTCGFDWSAGKWDGWYGLGEQMCAMEVIQNLLAYSSGDPKKAN